jgi:hypothetical protein
MRLISKPLGVSSKKYNVTRGLVNSTVRLRKSNEKEYTRHPWTPRQK